MAAAMPMAHPDQEPLSIHWWNAQPRDPSTMHLYVFREMEECLGIEGDFAGLSWFSADFILRSDFVRLGGFWVAAPRRIMLAADMFDDPPTVSHEIIHDLTNGVAQENGPAFKRCEIKPL